MHSKKVTKTVILPLETSERKNERVSETIEEWQAIAKTVADHHPSFPKHEWGRTKQNPSFYRIVQREHPDKNIHSSGAVAAVHKVGEAFQSWQANKRGPRRPEFGDGDYCGFTNLGIEVEENGRGYGVKVKLEPYKPEWFHVRGGDYQREYLEGIVDGDLKTGSGELHLTDGRLACHLSVTEAVDVLEWGEVETTVGVDLGERVMYAAVAMNGYDVKEVQLERGSEFRHHRERIKDKKDRLQAGSKLRQAARAQYYRYTDHVTHTAARDIVKLADGHPNPGIVIEDLSHYRETATDPIHDWPFAELQTKLMYKATEAGIPVKKVSPEYSSITCRECGADDPRSRDGDRFKCVGCGYEVHADVNAAINIGLSE